MGPVDRPAYVSEMNWHRLRRVDLHLMDASREALGALRSRRPMQRRAALLCDLGDALSRKRPRDWKRRARRAYLGAIRRLDVGAGQDALTASEPAAVAHVLLGEARRPYRRFAAVLTRVTVVAVVGLAGLALIVSAASRRAREWLFPPDLGATAKWQISSTIRSDGSAGQGTRSDGPCFFHTDDQDHPWIQITLPKVAKVREIRIENREDCCQDRALPLNVQVPDGNDWRLLCQRRSPFSTWKCHPPPTKTRVIRIEHAGHHALHLKRVSIFE